jgi:tetratricopeptide (TPR) repeat protein
MLTERGFYAGLLILGLGIAACGGDDPGLNGASIERESSQSGREAGPKLSKAKRAQQEARAAKNRAGAQNAEKPAEAPKPEPMPEPDWTAVFPSELITELAPPDLASLASRLETDEQRLVQILAADLRGESRRVKNLRERLSLKPKDSALLMELGLFYYFNELPNLAEVQFLKALVEDDHLGVAHKLLTDIYRQAGSHARAVYHGRRAHRDLPKDSMVLFLWGWAVRDSGDIDAAIPIAERGEELHQGDPRVLGLLALLRGDEERFEQSRDYAQRAIRADPDHLRAYSILGRALSALGDEQAGEVAMQAHRRILLLQAADLLDRDPPLLEWERAAALANYYHIVGREEQVQEELARSYELLPNNPSARAVDASISIANGDEIGAFAILEGLFEQYPTDLQSARNLANLLVTCRDEQLRDYQRARSLTTALMERGGRSDTGVLLALGTAEAHLGQLREAKRHLRTALAIDPGSDQVQKMLAALESGEF